MDVGLSVVIERDQWVRLDPRKVWHFLPVGRDVSVCGLVVPRPIWVQGMGAASRTCRSCVRLAGPGGLAGGRLGVLDQAGDPGAIAAAWRQTRAL